MKSDRPLTGEELLAAWRSFAGGKKSEMVRACGYVGIKKDGTERLNFTAFYEALAKAKEAAGAIEDVRRQSSEEIRKAAENEALLRLRKVAQRKLRDGKPLTKEELDALPEFQRNALVRDGKMILESATEKMVGRDLLDAVKRLDQDGLAEVSIAIRCGYASDEIGSFRRELSRLLGVPIAPLERLLREPGASRGFDLAVVRQGELSDQTQVDDLSFIADDVEDAASMERREVASSLVSRRLRSNRFRQEIMRRHEPVCACCYMDIPQLLEAAHIRPVEQDGSDHAGNGFPLCPTHHLAFDRHFFCIDSQSGEILCAPGMSLSRLGIEKLKVSLVLNKDALEYRRNMFLAFWSSQ